MSEANNGQQLSCQGNSCQGNYTGELISPKRRAMIIALLGTGETVTEVSRRTGACKRTIYAIRDREHEQISQRKARLADLCDRIAFRGFDQIRQHLDSGLLSPLQLVSIFDVCVDKALALRGEYTPHRKSRSRAARYR